MTSGQSRLTGPVLTYAPLPDGAASAAHDSIINLGFKDRAFVERYQFSDRGGRRITTNAVIFADEVHRTPAQYASITLFNDVDSKDDASLVSVLAQSAAPFHLIHRDGRFSLIGGRRDGDHIYPVPIVSGVGYDQLDQALGAFAADLSPRRITDAKQNRGRFVHEAFQAMNPFQLSLWVADVTGRVLVDHFTEAIATMRAALKAAGTPDDDGIVLEMAVQLLAAIILGDTGVLSTSAQSPDVPLETLLRVTQERFPRYFTARLFEEHREATEAAYRGLRRVSYAGFVPDMLTDLYRAAFGKEQAKAIGRFDTPLYLTRRMWDAIPVEFLSPDRRIAADMTCGWGSFLIAGYERLSRLPDSNPSALRHHLHGNDKDLSAALLAGLGLLVSTSEDSWHVDHDDALQWPWLQQARPSIIVGNPPFGGNRKVPTVPGKRHQEADRFLGHAIDRLAPGGYLAMLMPQTFIASESAPALRRSLLEACDVIETWQLPLGVFEAAANTVALFARKKEVPGRSGKLPVRTRAVQGGASLERFKESGVSPVFTTSTFVRDQSDWIDTVHRSPGSGNTHVMHAPLILTETGWESIRARSVRLDERAVIFPGCIVGRNPHNKRHTNNPFPETVPWLAGAKKAMPTSFVIDYGTASKIAYPNDLEEPRLQHQHLLAGPKVLVKALPNPSWGLRMGVAIERRGYYVSNSFWVAVPTEGAQRDFITLEVLAAILSWKVANAWVVEHLRAPNITAYAIRHVPFPSRLGRDDCETLMGAVLVLERAAEHGDPTPTEPYSTIDRVLRRAYGLDDGTYERLRAVAEWGMDGTVTLDPPSLGAASDWVLNGRVEDLDARRGAITVWIDGFNELLRGCTKINYSFRRHVGGWCSSTRHGTHPVVGGSSPSRRRRL